MTYRNQAFEFNVTIGSAARQIASHQAGRAYLIQSLRIYCDCPNGLADGTPYQVDLAMEDDYGVAFYFPSLFVPPSPTVRVIDLLPVISNLAAFGYEAPSYLALAIAQGLVAGDRITSHVFSIEGAIE